MQGARRDSRVNTWSMPQASAVSYHQHLIPPDDLPPGVDPVDLPHAAVMHIYAWDSSYASGMHTIATPIGVRDTSQPPSLNMPHSQSSARRCFAQPFSGYEVADAAGMPRVAYGVWLRAHEIHDPSELPPGVVPEAPGAYLRP
jgi:hypothetical protein